MKKLVFIFLLVISVIFTGYFFLTKNKGCLPIYRKKDYSAIGIKNPKSSAKLKEKEGRGISFAPPEVAILLYRPKLAEFIRKTYKTTPCDGYLSKYVFFLDKADKKIAIVSNFDLFAPGVTYIVEKLIEYGVKKVVAVGSSGSLQPKLSAGSVVVCDRAIRDDGISQHYIPPSYDIKGSKQMTNILQDILKKATTPYLTGATWTMNAIYRQTPQEVDYYKKQNILTVEAEAAALFAVGKYRKIPIGVVLVISDVLFSDGVWEKTRETIKKTRTVLENVSRATIDYFISFYEQKNHKNVM